MARDMRRKERKVTNPEAIQNIIDAGHVLHVGLIDGRSVMVVPVNYGYKIENNQYTFYFHGAKEGRKMDLIAQNGYCGFEMETAAHVAAADQACGHTEKYQSIMGEGPIVEITDSAEKIEALRLIMGHNTGKSDWKFLDKVVERTAVIKIVAEELSCKQNQ